MNIVYLAPFAFSPKATVSARMLPMATALVRRGHRVTVLMPPYDNPADSGKAWEHEGVQLENMQVTRRHGSTIGYWQLAKQLAEHTRELNPDVIHVFKPVGVSALAMWLLRQSPLQGHSAISNNQSPILDNDDWEGPGGWLDVNPYSPAQKLFFRWQERWALRAAPQVTCASEVLVERTRQFRANNPRDANDIHLLPNGPDEAMRARVMTAQSKRAALRVELGWGNEPVVIYAGTIPLNHDLDIAVKSISNLARLKWAIIASGDGIPSLEQAIAQAGIGDRVEWHRFMPHERLVEYLVAADVAVYPYRDTNINRAKCSGKVIDYMACGLPMVVSDVGMNRVYLEDGVSGLLTLPGDSEAFGAAMQRLIEDRPFATQLGQAAQVRIWQQFGWDERIVKLEAIYRSTSVSKPIIER